MATLAGSGCAGSDDPSATGAQTFGDASSDESISDTNADGESESEVTTEATDTATTSADGADAGSNCPDGYAASLDEAPDFGCAIFVDIDAGDDANDGTQAAPVASLAVGLELAETQGKPVVVATLGDYEESLTLPDGVSLFGGYSSGSWNANAGMTQVLSPEPVAVRAWSLTQSAVLADLTIVAAAGASAQASSIGIEAIDAADLSMGRCNISSADGLGGSMGMGGTAGEPVSGGGNGDPGCDDCSGGGGGGMGGLGCGINNGGDGGQGAYANNTGGMGNAGTGDMPGGGGGGGGGDGSVCAFGCSDGGTGQPGGVGQPGAAGMDGLAGSSAGEIVGGRWRPVGAGAGTAGTAGSGGGGGGGGGGSDCCLNDRGGGGGGGGGGGCPGTEGSGGGGGGASFGVYAHNSNLWLVESTVTSANGGIGGDAGDGGMGSSGGGGGGGGNGPDNGGNGGPGGVGGDGGRGGHGGGGGGGPSFAVYAHDTATVDLAEDVVLTPGEGGAGGASMGNAGEAGASGASNF